MSERFVAADSSDPLFAWPPFMVAQTYVLGKNYPYLRAPLEDPQVDEARAFAALTQLSVLVRLLSGQPHHLAPSNPFVENSFTGTEMLHDCQNCPKHLSDRRLDAVFGL
jgi:hypothetical protein